MSEPSYLRSALFVDFDNIFLGFDRQQTEAAELFASSPDRWVRWLEEQVPVAYGGFPQKSLARKILVRRCYINPRSFHEYRPSFIRSGFEVVDCPPLTLQGKTSADIHMVIDMLDALAHPTQFDEFIVLSGDADFTPVLLRLRKYDRRTMILAVGPASPAYKSASDFLLDESLFLEQGLGFEDAGARKQVPSKEISKTTKRVLVDIAKRLEELANMTGQVYAVELPRIYKEFSEFRSSENWLGFYSLRKLTEAVVDISSVLAVVDEDPWWVEVSKKEHEAANDLPSLQEIGEVVKSSVVASDSPVVLAAVAHEVYQKFGEKIRLSNWLDAGSFKALIETLDLDNLEVSAVIPGYVFDPDRHEAPRSPVLEESAERESMLPIARKVSRFTETPYLTTSQYAAVFREITNEVNENGYHLTQTSKAVRDRCAGKSIPIARSHVSFILKGIVFAGHRFGETQEDAASLGAILVENTLSLCDREQMKLTDQDVEDIKAWILGDL